MVYIIVIFLNFNICISRNKIIGYFIGDFYNSVVLK